MVVQLEKREALAKEAKLLVNKKKTATVKGQGKSTTSRKSARKIRDPELEKVERRQKRNHSGTTRTTSPKKARKFFLQIVGTFWAVWCWQ